MASPSAIGMRRAGLSARWNADNPDKTQSFSVKTATGLSGRKR
jgi:hypothetical protein